MKHYLSILPLLAGLIVLPATAHALDAEIYVGSALGADDINYGPQNGTNLVDTDSGLAIGGGLYMDIPFSPPNMSAELGLDLMHTNRDYSDWYATCPNNSSQCSNLQSLSLMLNGRLEYALSPMTEVYGGVGLGVIKLDYDDPAAFLDGDDTVNGWKTEAGVRYQLPAPNWKIFGMVKHQAGFDEGIIQMEYVEYKSTSLLAGLRYEF